METLDHQHIARLFKEESFPLEARLGDLLESNMSEFCRDIFGFPPLYVKREFRLGQTIVHKSIKPPTIDFLVELTNGSRVGIECKGSNKSTPEIVAGLSQLLAYSIYADGLGTPFDELVLVSGTYHPILQRVVEKYHLPVRVVFLSKRQKLVYVPRKSAK